jgi:hypothetical protein
MVQQFWNIRTLLLGMVHSETEIDRERESMRDMHSGNIIIDEYSSAATILIKQAIKQIKKRNSYSCISKSDTKFSEIK